MQSLNLVIIIAGTVIIALLSWFLSIKYRRYHGISRFFAFESIFILFLLNYRAWLVEPFSTIHIISWLLLIASVYIALAGYLLLKVRGNPTVNFEDTSVIVKSGIYGYIRHPLYLSLFMLGTGIILKDPGAFQIILGIVNLISLLVTALIEEAEMLSKFGDQYRVYMNETKMFIPFFL
jgi:protein-S-isoprenylcysteine O-methyltransferase Ste14